MSSRTICGRPLAVGSCARTVGHAGRCRSVYFGAAHDQAGRQVPARARTRTEPDDTAAALRRFDQARDYYRTLKRGEHYSAEELARSARVYSTWQAERYLAALRDTRRAAYDDERSTWRVL